ncbi:MAG TPA: c-type cytochrome domain-containing protein [Terriglobales bacterium]|nr:c-type cytochrome domain-containing protein [Terriglobales bacterium]
MNVPGRSFDQSCEPSLTTPNRGFPGEFRLGFVMLAPILAVTILAAVFPPDGKERAHWVQFIGRFHPFVVHFPIALFLLVPILEIAGRSIRFTYLRLSVPFVLSLATVGASIASILGWSLARSGGYSGTLMIQHMWGGVVLSIVCCACWMLRPRLQVSVAYATVLVLGVGLVAWTGYRGGQLSLGPNHLTEFMPNGLRALLGVEDSHNVGSADPNTFYGARIQPIFSARCINCHGADKHKGNLRLDSYRALMRGGKDGPVIQTGNIQESDLLRRIKLPSNHDDFMPKGKQPLAADEVKTIELWIAAGASDTLAVNAINNAPSGSAVPAEVKFEKIDPLLVARLRSAIGPVVSQLQNQFPGILDYDSRNSAELRLNASILGIKFGDRDLETFAPVAEHIIVADFSRTSITDHSAAAIAAMKQLRVLRLIDTRLTDATLLQFETLNQLESLNAYGTAITPAVLPTIARLPKLSRFYAGQTGILPGKSVPESLVGKLVF